MEHFDRKKKKKGGDESVKREKFISQILDSRHFRENFSPFTLSSPPSSSSSVKMFHLGLMFIYIHTLTCSYIERERERDREKISYAFPYSIALH